MSQTPDPGGGSPGGGSPSEPHGPTDVTLAKLFQSLGLLLWFSTTITQHFGQNGELGEDFGIHANTPIGSATAGKVVAVWQDPSGSSIGTIVQVEAPDGSLWHYQHMRTASVQPGEQVYPGTVLGLSGGCPTGGYSGNPAVCTRYDQFSTNPHIEVRYAPKYDPHGGLWNQHWIDPNGIFAALPNTTVGSEPHGPGGGSPGGGGGSCGPMPNPGNYPLGVGDPQYAAALVAWNLCMRNGGSNSGTSSGCAHSITIPALPGSQPTVVCMDPAIDFAARAALILVAVILLVMAIYLFTHQNATVGGAGQQAQSKVEGVAKLATLAV